MLCLEIKDTLYTVLYGGCIKPLVGVSLVPLAVSEVPCSAWVWLEEEEAVSSQLNGSYMGRGKRSVTSTTTAAAEHVDLKADEEKKEGGGNVHRS